MLLFSHYLLFVFFISRPALENHILIEFCKYVSFVLNTLTICELLVDLIEYMVFMLRLPCHLLKWDLGAPIHDNLVKFSPFFRCLVDLGHYVDIVMIGIAMLLAQVHQRCCES